MTETDTTPDTQRIAYDELTDDGEDITLRKQVASALAADPATTRDLADRMPDTSHSSIVGRINELKRMDCLDIMGTATNPSGNEAQVYALTDTGEAYLRGDVNPEPTRPLSSLQADVVATARAFIHDDADESMLRDAITAHDDAKATREPGWSRPYSEADSDPDWADMTEAERQQVRDDPLLSPSDFGGGDDA